MRYKNVITERVHHRIGRVRYRARAQEQHGLSRREPLPLRAPRPVDPPRKARHAVDRVDRRLLLTAGIRSRGRRRGRAV